MLVLCLGGFLHFVKGPAHHIPSMSNTLLKLHLTAVSPPSLCLQSFSRPPPLSHAPSPAPHRPRSEPYLASLMHANGAHRCCQCMLMPPQISNEKQLIFRAGPDEEFSCRGLIVIRLWGQEQLLTSWTCTERHRQNSKHVYHRE